MKTKGAKRGFFRVVKVVKRTGAVRYHVVGTTADGVRIREKKYKLEAEANYRRDTLFAESQNIEQDSKFKQTWLPTKVLRVAEGLVPRLKKLLHPEKDCDDVTDGELAHSFQLMGDWFIQDYKPALKEITVAEAFEKFIADKETDNLRPRTIGNLKSRLKPLVEKHGSMKVSEVSRQDVLALVKQPGVTARTRIGNRLALTNFFNWCVEDEFCRENPVKLKRKSIKADVDEPTILTADEVAKLVTEASTFKNGRLLPYVVLATFCGLRPAELARIQWDAIDIEGKTITVGAKVSKVRGRRVLEKVPENVITWLKPHYAEKTPICPPSFRRDFDELREKLGYAPAFRRKQLAEAGEKTEHLKDWEPDILRHTALSFHFAYHGDEGDTAKWGGTSPGVLHNHYKALATKAQAEQFWKIAPPPDGKIIQLPAPAVQTQVQPEAQRA